MKQPRLGGFNVIHDKAFFQRDTAPNAPDNSHLASVTPRYARDTELSLSLSLSLSFSYSIASAVATRTAKKVEPLVSPSQARCH
jgi:hypothetical protein